ncbi:SSH1 [Bugula neritina]|uniref:SSH1 n=1 Tax=Bugula neritina TaxID=10212 RepID=A0A7J7JNS4_BUGNE|nr:SSH1 [Bugula neritina]
MLLQAIMLSSITAIQLDSLTHYSKYLAIVVTNSDTGECQQGTIIGFHCSDEEAFIGLVLPIYRNTSVVLDGDGGFQISTEERYYVFKPTGVQAMWSAWMAFTKVCSVAQENNHRKCGSTHTWLSHYTDRITQQQSLVNEWNELDDLMSRRQDSYAMNREDDSDSLKRELRIHLREILIHSDLEELTSIRLEGRVGQPLKQYRRFIDEEMMLMIRQLDVASQIFDFVYLGTEWNASNLKDLQTCGIGYILNVTKEIDNFFPGLFKYKNIRLYDEEHVNLMKHWEHTHKFICDARDNNSKVLVHCKMGISSKQRWNSVFSGEEDKGMSRDTLLQKNESDLFSSTSSASAAAADSQTDTTLDEACTGMAAPTHTIENNSSTSDSESTDSDAGSTVGSQLEEDAVFTSSGSPDNEPGVSNSQPCSDIISPEQAAPRDPLFSTHTTCSNPAGEEFSGLSPSNHLQTSLNISAETETEVANDVSVCSGVVQKTKHQIIGLSQNQTAVTKQGEPVPVTPGTVRKVLGKIEQQYVM